MKEVDNKSKCHASYIHPVALSPNCSKYKNLKVKDHLHLCMFRVGFKSPTLRFLKDIDHTDQHH